MTFRSRKINKIFNFLRESSNSPLLNIMTIYVNLCKPKSQLFQKQSLHITFLYIFFQFYAINKGTIINQNSCLFGCLAVTENQAYVISQIYSKFRQREKPSKE